MTETLVHFEQLLGCGVFDVCGEVSGRLEELRVEQVSGEDVVTEYHIGPAALIERVASFVTQLPFLRLIPREEWEYRIPWKTMDLSDPERPKLSVGEETLVRVRPER